MMLYDRTESGLMLRAWINWVPEDKTLILAIPYALPEVRFVPDMCSLCDVSVRGVPILGVVIRLHGGRRWPTMWCQRSFYRLQELGRVVPEWEREHG